MSTELSASAQKVQDALAAHGVSCQVVELPASTRSAQEAAGAIGCQVAQIVKSLIFRGRQTGQPVLVLASGPNRVSESHIGRLLGEPIERADADFVRQRTGFVIGGVPPVGHNEAIRSYIRQGPAAVRRAVGGSRNTPRRVPADSRRPAADQRR